MNIPACSLWLTCSKPSGGCLYGRNGALPSMIFMQNNISFQDKVSLYSPKLSWRLLCLPGWLKLRDPLVSASLVQGPKVCTTDAHSQITLILKKFQSLANAPLLCVSNFNWHRNLILSCELSGTLRDHCQCGTSR